MSQYEKWMAVTLKMLSMWKIRKCVEFDFSGSTIVVAKERLTYSFGAPDDTGIIKMTADEKSLNEIGV